MNILICSSRNRSETVLRNSIFCYHTHTRYHVKTNIFSMELEMKTENWEFKIKRMTDKNSSKPFKEFHKDYFGKTFLLMLHSSNDRHDFKRLLAPDIFHCSKILSRKQNISSFIVAWDKESICWKVEKKGMLHLSHTLYIFMYFTSEITFNKISTRRTFIFQNKSNKKKNVKISTQPSCQHVYLVNNFSKDLLLSYIFKN